MAISKTPKRELPKFLLVSEYTVRRLGLYPSVTVRLTECSYLLGPQLVISASADLDADGLVDVLTVQDLGSAPKVVGHILSDLSSTAVTTITAYERVLVSAEIPSTTAVEPTIPAVYVSKVTLATGLSAAQLVVPMAVVARMPVGTTAYAPTPAGRTWEITLNGDNPAAMQEMGKLLGNTYFAASKAVLAKLGITTVTDTQLGGAIQALGNEGTNIDGFLAQQGEALETKRDAGQLGYAVITGQVP